MLWNIKEPSSAYLITDKDHRSFTPVHYAAGKGQAKVRVVTQEYFERSTQLINSGSAQYVVGYFPGAGPTLRV